jgi:hypothetical protein
MFSPRLRGRRIGLRVFRIGLGIHKLVLHVCEIRVRVRRTRARARVQEEVQSLLQAFSPLSFASLYQFYDRTNVFWNHHVLLMHHLGTRISQA